MVLFSNNSFTYLSNELLSGCNIKKIVRSTSDKMHVSSLWSANCFDVVGYFAFIFLPTITVVACELRYRVGVLESCDLVILVIRVDMAWIQVAFVDFVGTTS